MWEYPLLLASSFTACLLVLSGTKSSRAFEKRLAGLKRTLPEGALPQGTLPGRRGLQVYLAGKSASILTWLQAIGWLATLRKESGTEVAGKAFALQVGGSALAGAVLAGAAARSLSGALLGCVTAAVLPFGLLVWKRKKRVERIEAALPGAIDLLARSLRAGHSLGSAFDILAKSCPKPLGDEFTLISQQQKHGVMFRDTMREFARRVPSRDIRFLVTGVLLQHESGGDLTEMLDTIRGVIADRARIAGLVQVHSAQGRFTGWVLSGLPLALLALMRFVNPAYARVFWEDHTGRELLLGCFLLIATGLGVIRRIVAVKQ